MPRFALPKYGARPSLRTTNFGARIIARITRANPLKNSVPASALEIAFSSSNDAPAQNGPVDAAVYADIRSRVPEARKAMFASVGATNFMLPSPPLAEFDEARARALGARARAMAESEFDWWVVGGRIADEVLRREGARGA